MINKSILFLLGFAMLLTTKCSNNEIAFNGTPEGTFDALVASIKARDLDAYATCWYTGTAEREGMISRIKEDPKLWDELNAMFKGKLTLVAGRTYEIEEGTIKKFEVKAPEVPKGDGIGGISMIKVGEIWKMYHW